ncbi:MAG: response regulator [Rhodospirillaceae bacterium]|nr:response regulator [Rhodospirillaceae bacterium]
MSSQRKKAARLDNSEILAAAGHDLRQPMHSLNLVLGALAGRAEDSETAALVNSAQISADGVTSVLETLLSIAAMDAADAAPEISEFDVQELLQYLREQFAQRAANKGLQLRVVPCTLRIKSDRVLLQRILDALISNAIRHTESGHILLGCRRTKGALRIGVLDQGPGLSEDMAARFFTVNGPDGANCQDGALSKTSWRGYALGLSIAQYICAALGHDMTVLSREGKGAAIWLKVALAETRNESVATTISAPPHAPEKSDAAIVIVEDDPDILLATTQFLTDWGYRVCGGRTAEAAIQDIEANGGGACPDLVLSDFNLTDGQTALDAIAELNRHFDSKIPAIIITGDPSAPGIAEARELNYEILNKPLRAAKLRTLVRYALAENSQTP